MFKFDILPDGLQLVSDTFEQLKPGLSAYAGKEGDGRCLLHWCVDLFELACEQLRPRLSAYAGEEWRDGGMLCN